MYSILCKEKCVLFLNENNEHKKDTGHLHLVCIHSYTPGETVQIIIFFSLTEALKALKAMASQF